MTEPGPAGRLRVAVLAGTGRAVEWPPLLGVGNAELVRVNSPGDLAGAAADLAVAFATGKEATAILAAFAARPDAPPPR